MSFAESGMCTMGHPSTVGASLGWVHEKQSFMISECAASIERCTRNWVFSDCKTTFPSSNQNRRLRTIGTSASATISALRFRLVGVTFDDIKGIRYREDYAEGEAGFKYQKYVTKG